MVALTENRNTEWQPGDVLSVPMGVDIIYKGSIVAINAAGFVVPASDTAGEVVLGIALEKVDNSGGSAGDKNVRVQIGGVAELTGSGLAQGDVGAEVFASDDQTVATTTTNSISVGAIVKFESATSVRVLLSTPASIL